MTDRGLFEPDVLITEQFITSRRRAAALSGEKRLMLAVLANALDDYQKYLVAKDRIGRGLFADAAAWIECTSDQDSFSFEGISDALGISPGYLRRGLAAWRARLLDVQCRTTEMPAAIVPAEPQDSAAAVA